MGIRGSVEEEIRKHAKTTMEIRSLYEQWYRTFQEGAMGNQVAYAQARDSRKELEKPNWVPLDVVLGVVAKAEAERNQKLQEILDNAGEIHQFYIPTWLREKLVALVCEGKSQPPKTETNHDKLGTF